MTVLYNDIDLIDSAVRVHGFSVLCSFYCFPNAEKDGLLFTLINQCMYVCMIAWISAMLNAVFVRLLILSTG